MENKNFETEEVINNTAAEEVVDEINEDAEAVAEEAPAEEAPEKTNAEETAVEELPEEKNEEAPAAEEPVKEEITVTPEEPAVKVTVKEPEAEKLPKTPFFKSKAWSHICLGLLGLVFGVPIGLLIYTIVAYFF